MSLFHYCVRCFTNIEYNRIQLRQQVPNTTNSAHPMRPHLSPVQSLEDEELMKKKIKEIINNPNRWPRKRKELLNLIITYIDFSEMFIKDFDLYKLEFKCKVDFILHFNRIRFLLDSLHNTYDETISDVDFIDKENMIKKLFDQKHSS